MTTKVVEKTITNQELHEMFQATLDELRRRLDSCIGCPHGSDYREICDSLQEDLDFAQLFSDVKVTAFYTEVIEPEPLQRNGTHG